MAGLGLSSGLALLPHVLFLKSMLKGHHRAGACPNQDDPRSWKEPEDKYARFEGFVSEPGTPVNASHLVKPSISGAG